VDYSNTIVNLTFEIGDTTKIMNVPITNDCETEGSENFIIVLRRFDTSVGLLQPFHSVGIITDTGEISNSRVYFVMLCMLVPLIAMSI